MLAVHGFWSAGRGLCLWAEDAERTVKSPSQALRSARPHPFAATADQLAELHPGKAGAAMLVLPSLLTAPLDSPELVRVTPRPEPTRRPALFTWSVPVMAFEPQAALAVLDTPSTDVRYGASVRFLAELADFARDLTDRGRALPTIDEDEDGYLALWRPVLQGPDVVTMQSFVTAMPPICRAEADVAGDTAGQHPVGLVEDMLHALVDAAVRERITGTTMLPPRRGRPPATTPVEETWLAALAHGNGRFVADHAHVAALEQIIAPWNGFGRGDPGRARATFRLTEGTGTERSDVGDTDDALGDASTRWRLDFLLQSIEDPSLLVPAEQVWTGGDGLRRWLDRPDELLLAELGRASVIYPQLTGALRQARPRALELDADAAYEFLSVHAAVLDQAGFGVHLPSWWTKQRKLGLTASASPAPTSSPASCSAASRCASSSGSWPSATNRSPRTSSRRLPPPRRRSCGCVVSGWRSIPSSSAAG